MEGARFFDWVFRDVSVQPMSRAMERMLEEKRRA